MTLTTELVSSAKLTFRVDDYDLAGSAGLLANFGQDRFGYIVTPNVDHLIRCYDDPAFRQIYQEASYVLFDSRFLARILRVTRGILLPVCTGSDMTAQLLERVIHPDDNIVLVGSTNAQARRLATKFGLESLRHINPPMGFIDSPEAVEECLRYIEQSSPFRFCLIAVGSPQGEMIANMLKRRGRCIGLTLCIGASINFLTGAETRAPLWLRQVGLEWLYRLLSSPKRLAKRYLVKGPRVFRLLRDIEFELRPHSLSAPARQPINQPAIHSPADA